MRYVGGNFHLRNGTLHKVLIIQLFSNMEKRIKYADNYELWHIESELKKAGYKKNYDCYWCQEYQKGEDIITLERN